MDERWSRRDCGNAAQGRDMVAAEREWQRNRLCELRREPCFEEWWRLTLALGPEECLLLLAAEVGDSVVERASALPIGTPGDEDRWVNPLLPLPLPGSSLFPLSLPHARPDNSTASVAASAE